MKGTGRWEVNKNISAPSQGIAATYSIHALLALAGNLSRYMGCLCVLSVSKGAFVQPCAHARNTDPGYQLKGRGLIDFYHLALKVFHYLIFAQVSLGTPC